MPRTTNHEPRTTLPPPHVAVVVLNWNGKQDTIKCLDSLRQNQYQPTTIYLVDNGSADDSVEFFRREYPEVELIANPHNLGFAEGNNVALRQALVDRADYFLLLNNDATVAPETIHRLVAAGEANPGSGILGPKTLVMEHPDHIYVVGVYIDYWKGWTREVGMGERDLGQYEAPRRFDAMSGCALMVKRVVLEKVGLLDATFFAYFEEIDWCARSARAGYEIWYEPTAHVWHKGHGSNAGIARYFLLFRNQLLFMRKNAPWPACAFFWPFFFGWSLPKKLFLHLLNKDFTRAWVLLQAVGWNFGLFHRNNPLVKIQTKANG